MQVFFLKFNECMEECNYDLADETIELIKSHIEIIVHMFNALQCIKIQLHKKSSLYYVKF